MLGTKAFAGSAPVGFWQEGGSGNMHTLISIRNINEESGGSTNYQVVLKRIKNDSIAASTSGVLEAGEAVFLSGRKLFSRRDINGHGYGTISTTPNDQTAVWVFIYSEEQEDGHSPSGMFSVIINGGNPF